MPIRPHPFYRLAPVGQWAAALALAPVGVLLPALTLVWPVLILTAPLWFSVFSSSLTPLLRLTGLARYRSPLFLTMWSGPGQFELHGGTLFDYFGLFRVSEAGPRIRREVMCLYLEGLDELAGSVTRGELDPQAVLTASSWIFSDHSARRLGFTTRPARFTERFPLYLGLLDLTVMLYFARGSWTMPRVQNALRAETTAQTLVEHRAALRDLLTRVRRDDRGNPYQTPATSCP